MVADPPTTFRAALIAFAIALAGSGCSGGFIIGGGDDDDDNGADGGGAADAAVPGRDDGGMYPGTGDDLDTATGCPGVFNPGQLLDYELTMASGDWSTVKSDMTNSIYVPAELSCGGMASITVGVRRKRSGTADKPGLKVDINELVPGQTYYDLRKLSLENGVSEGSGSGEVKALMEEYLAWRLFVRSDAISGRAAFARVFVNGQLLGVYVQVEQVDKRFLRSRIGHDDGWLWKFSGSDRDGLKTNEGTDDPYDDYFCFFQRTPSCPAPPPDELETKLDVSQLLAVGAVNALMANTDAPILKFNNYIYYDWPGPRLYFPWDLDTVMGSDYDVFTGTVPGGTTAYTDVLFPTWEDDYASYLGALLAGPLTLEAIEAEIDQAVDVAGAALDDDPYLGGGAQSAADDLKAYWAGRHAAVSDQVAQH